MFPRSEHPANHHDVLIAGAGPVGLFLACELRLANVSVLVLEKAGHPRSPLKQLPFGLRGLSAPTLEAFDRRGLLPAVTPPGGIEAAPGGAAHWAGQARRPAGHFAGLQFFHDRIDAARWAHRLPGPAGTSMAVSLDALETVLADRAEAMGVEIRRGVEVTDVQAADRDVTVRAGGELFRAGWLVGCDGGRSMVRKAAGFDFAGTDPEFTGYSAAVELADPDALRPGRHYTAAGMYTYTPSGMVTMVDFDRGARHRQPVTRDHLQAVLRRVSDTDVTVNALRLAATWTDRACQATAYRRGRVLLAGDAAHVHSPLGGQGLNLGLGDAMNLGWKLAAVIRGTAPPDLLDSYEHERRPVGAAILDWSRAQVALMRPSRGSDALRAVIRDLIDTRDGATYMAERVWAVSLAYDPGDDPTVGRSAPDITLADGTRLATLLAAGRGLFLDFGAAAPYRALARGFADRVAYEARDAPDRLGLGAILVRPDGVVAWAEGAAPDHAGAAQALSRWFGDAAEG